MLDIRMSMALVWAIAVFIICWVITISVRRRYRITKSQILLSSIPGIWTSFGILGTFISILLALSTIDLNSEDLLINLVREIAPAFSTSIVGLVGAIISTLRNKYILASAEVEYDEEFRNSSHTGKSPDYILDEIGYKVRGSYEILQRLEEIAENNELMLEDLVEEISSGILEEVDKHLVNKMDELTTSHTHTLKMIFEREEQYLSMAVDEIRGVTSGVKDALVSCVDEMKTGMSEIASNAQKELAKMSGSLENSLKEVEQNLVHSFADSIGTKIDAVVRSIEESINKMQEGITSHAEQNIKSMLNEVVTEAKGSIVTLNDSLKIIDKDFKSICSNVKTVSDNLCVNMDSYEQMSELVLNIKNSFKSLEVLLATFTGKVEVNNSKITEILENVTKLSELNYRLSFEVSQLKKRKAENVRILEDGSLECPECKTINPGEASFCRKCRYAFILPEHSPNVGRVNGVE